jgi:hypothetical protein
MLEYKTQHEIHVVNRKTDSVNDELCQQMAEIRRQNWVGLVTELLEYKGKVHKILNVFTIN